MAYSALDIRLGLRPGLIASVMSIDLVDQYDTAFIKPKKTVIHRTRKSLKVRQVFSPHKNLKQVQRRIGMMIAQRFTPHPIAHAYTRGRSIVSNARTHLGCDTMLHIDLKAFFASISHCMVVKALAGVLDDFSLREIDLIAEICCRAGYLPQGAPTSPVLSNLVCLPMDVRLYNLARANRCAVGRYSDDIGFSTAAERLPQALVSGSYGHVEIGEPIIAIFAEHGFDVNWSKVRLDTLRSGIKATGLNIGTSVTVPRKFRDNIRAALDHWSRYGIIHAARSSRAHSPDAFAQALRGSIGFVGHVEGKDSPRYRRLIDAYNDLHARAPA